MHTHTNTQICWSYLLLIFLCWTQNRAEHKPNKREKYLLIQWDYRGTKGDRIKWKIRGKWPFPTNEHKKNVEREKRGPIRLFCTRNQYNHTKTKWFSTKSLGLFSMWIDKHFANPFTTLWCAYDDSTHTCTARVLPSISIDSLILNHLNGKRGLLNIIAIKATDTMKIHTVFIEMVKLSEYSPPGDKCDILSTVHLNFSFDQSFLCPPFNPNWLVINVITWTAFHFSKNIHLFNTQSNGIFRYHLMKNWCHLELPNQICCCV